MASRSHVTARVDPSLVRAAVNHFPGPPWDVYRPPHEPRADWGLQPSMAGVYAFLFPRELLPKVLEVRMYRGQVTAGGDRPEEVLLRYDVAEVQGGIAESFVAYVGRTTDLLRRLRWHFSIVESTTAAQVRKGLEAAMEVGREGASEFMREHATVVLLHAGLSGLKNTANRDAIECSLVGRYMPPFNIKAER